jgi:hypothetical protein
MSVLQDHVGGGSPVTQELLTKGHEKGSAENDAIEIVLKGLEATLPDGKSFFDKDGLTRHEARVKWWAPVPRTFRHSTLTEGLAEQLPEDPLPGDLAMREDRDERPLLFGHYWHRGTPSLQSTKTLCVDYSAVLGGSLVAYRWSGEQELAASNVVSVPGLAKAKA